MNSQQIQGIIFDLDGTLYRMRFMKFQMALRLTGSLVFLRKLFAARASIRQRRFASQDDLLNTFYAELAALAGRSNEQAKNWYENKFYTAFINILKGATPRHGISNTLKSLRDCGVKLAVVSDFGRVRDRLSALGITPELFDLLQCSEESGVLKPAPEPFQNVSVAWNIAPERILVVGDRADRDGACARNAGMHFLGITEKQDKRAEFYCWKDALVQIEAKTNCGVNL